MPRAGRVIVAHPSADTYGSDLQLLESLDALRAAGWETTLCLPQTGPLLDLVDRPAEVAVLPFPVLRKSLLTGLGPLRLLAALPGVLTRLVRTIRSVRPDAVYVNTVTIPWWILAARLARVPVLVHVHEAEEDVPRIVRFGLNLPLLLARAIVANSAASARVVAESVPFVGRRTTVVWNGVPDQGAADDAAARPGRLALVARLSPRKGVDVALEAVARLRAEGRPVTLTVCGTTFPGYEWFEAQLRARADEPDLRGAVEFAGYVNPTLPVLAAASVVLVPSRVEPFGNTAVEALLARRPLVASDVQGLAEIVEHERTGLLVPPGDAAALAAGVARYLDDPAWAASVAGTGRDEALRRFGTDRYGADIVALVRSTARR